MMLVVVVAAITTTTMMMKITTNNTTGEKIPELPVGGNRLRISKELLNKYTEINIDIRRRGGSFCRLQ